MEVSTVTLDMRPMLRGEVSRIPIDYQLAPEALDGVSFGGMAHIVGQITDEAGYMHLTAQVTLPYRGECARCLAPVSGTYAMQFERTVVDEGTLTQEQLDDNVDEYVVISHGELDLDEEVREALVLSFPTRLLCEENCPGLCPVCGKPRREGPCGCPTREIDPRLAILRTLLDKNENDEK